MAEASYAEFTCQCPVGWTSAHCERDVDECAVSAPCHNDATCINTEGSYACLCLRGYEGKDCAINTDDCASCEYISLSDSLVSIFVFPFLYARACFC